MNQTRCLCSVISLSLALVACKDTNEDTPDARTDTPDVRTDTDAGAECPVPTGGPTFHHGDVTGQETWSASRGPHIVDADVSVQNGGKLVIEPCAEVRIANGAHIQVAAPLSPNSGALVAEGTPTKPILFKRNDAEPWASIFVRAPGTVRLAYATLEGGGGGDFEEGATIVAEAATIGDALLAVDHVTVRNSRGTGIWMKEGSVFATGSTDLTITGSGNDENPYPLTISEHAFDALPTGTYTGNKVDEIVIDPVGNGVAGGGMVKDATLHERGVPYHVGRTSLDNLTIGDPDSPLTTLSIEPGVIMKFEPETALEIQHFTTDTAATAAIRALGTAEKPIIFTSAAASPKAGDWRGLWFGGVPQASNKLDHVRIEYAGYSCACSLATCSQIDAFEGAVIFTGQPPSAFITNTTLAHVAGHGVTQGFDGTLVNFRPTNTFDDVSGCEQTRPRNPDTSCPDPMPACD